MRINYDESFEIEVSKEKIKKLKKWIDEYLNLYINGNLYPLYLQSKKLDYKGSTFYSYEHSKSIIAKIFYKEHKIHGSMTIRISLPVLLKHKTPNALGFLDLCNRWLDEPLIRVIETVFSMEKKAKLEILNMTPDAITVKVKDESLVKGTETSFDIKKEKEILISWDVVPLGTFFLKGRTIDYRGKKIPLTIKETRLMKALLKENNMLNL